MNGNTGTMRFTRAEAGAPITRLWQTVSAYRVERGGAHLGYVISTRTSVGAPMWCAYDAGGTVIASGCITRTAAGTALAFHYNTDTDGE